MVGEFLDFGVDDALGFGVGDGLPLPPFCVHEKNFFFGFGVGVGVGVGAAKSNPVGRAMRSAIRQIVL